MAGSNIIDVDFRAEKEAPPMSPAELVREVQSIREDFRKAEVNRQIWVRWQEYGYLERIRRLREQLRIERLNQFDDEAVHAALVEIHSAEAAPVSATSIAARLLRYPSHSAKVRVGLALSRLCAAGVARRIPGKKDYSASRWEPSDV